ncbi:MAG TPA: ABC transporter permease [Acidimicrobiales bacterium]|nr:ABC transporter permease [Acidimicrobiales bacterium]
MVAERVELQPAPVEVEADVRTATWQRIAGHRALRTWWPPLLVFIVLVVLWQYIPGAAGVQSYVLPTPTEIGAAIGDNSSVFWNGLAASAIASVVGFALSAVLGVLAACVMATWKPVELTLYPYMVVLSTVPIIAIAPLIIVWFGPGNLSILIITVIVGFFPVVANTVVGLQSASSTSVDLFRINGASKFQTLLKLRFPGSLPYIMASLKVTATLAVIGTIVGEYVAGTSGASGGLGYIIIVAANRLETSFLFGAAIASGLLGVVFFVLVSLVSRRVLGSWHESAMKAE